MDLNIRIIEWDDEYQVIIEGDGFTRVSRASSVGELVNALSSELTEILRDKNRRIELKPSDCTLRGWYIRLPIGKLMSVIAYMVKTGDKSTGGLLKYLDDNGLSRSNYRVIIPTLTALGLWKDGRLTRDAEELGRAILEGADALELLYRASMRNCMIKEAIEKLASGYSMDDVIKDMGLKRHDEIKYTVNFLETLMTTKEFQCLSFLRGLDNYLSGKANCAPGIKPPPDCVPTVIMNTYSYLINGKGFYMAELMSDVDINISLNSLSTQVVGDHSLLLFGGKVVGAVLGDVLVADSNYAPKAREAVDRLEEAAVRIMRGNNLGFALIIMPIVIQGVCPRLKVYVMVGTKLGDWIARVFDAP
ncbi:hypothetical protein [Vulcanisaeta thermophila]|uniref:hypothetical protein n=1 Tax=Vulcanisaeta thermophila TaxID=867917 RepID=UPI000853EB06|nr:hypothetical protein [Vulcanisaeta thermophila]